MTCGSIIISSISSAINNYLTDESFLVTVSKYILWLSLFENVYPGWAPTSVGFENI